MENRRWNIARNVKTNISFLACSSYENNSARKESLLLKNKLPLQIMDCTRRTSWRQKVMEKKRFVSCDESKLWAHWRTSGLWEFWWKERKSRLCRFPPHMYIVWLPLLWKKLKVCLKTKNILRKVMNQEHYHIWNQWIIRIVRQTAQGMNVQVNTPAQVWTFAWDIAEGNQLRYYGEKWNWLPR